MDSTRATAARIWSSGGAKSVSEASDVSINNSNFFISPYRYRRQSRLTSSVEDAAVLSMASGPHTFVTCSVFSPERFQGNPLAIVAVRGNALTSQRKSLIAKEFGYSETVFIHDAPGPGMPRRIDIYTEQGEEIPFAGHPVIGAAHYIFTYCERATYSGPQDRDTQRQTAVFMTKAGPVPIFFNPYRQVAACSVPHNLHVHKARLSLDDIINVQPQLRIVPTIDKCRGKTYPVISNVRGMTFGLIDLTDAPEMLGALKRSETPDIKLDEDWSPSFMGCLYYKKKEELVQKGEPTIHAIQARMISHGMEDPGTGSACCALACYLALGEGMIEKAEGIKQEEGQDQDDLVKKTENVKLEDTKQEQTQDQKPERHVYAIQQGLEMGRACTIAVEVDLKTDADGTRRVSNVTISGRANFFLKGELIGS